MLVCPTLASPHPLSSPFHQKIIARLSKAERSPFNANLNSETQESNLLCSFEYVFCEHFLVFLTPFNPIHPISPTRIVPKLTKEIDGHFRAARFQHNYVPCLELLTWFGLI